MREKLEDVDVSDLYHLDSGIKPLVQAIRGVFGHHKTIGSCEGGLEGTHHTHRYPFVTVSGVGFKDNPTHQQIEDKLNRFNQRGGVQWTTEVSAVRPKRAARSRKQLKGLQRSAGELARFMFEED